MYTVCVYAFTHVGMYKAEEEDKFKSPKVIILVNA